jgi:hypothetical protein
MKRKTKQTFAYLAQTSLSDLFSKKTILLVLVDLGIIFAIILAIIIGLFSFKESYQELLSLSPSLVLLAEGNLVQSETIEQLTSLNGSLENLRDKLNNILFSIVKSIILSIVLICIGFAFGNQLIWKLIKKTKLSLNLFGKFLVTTLLLTLFWSLIIFITIILLNIQVAIFFIIIELILMLNSYHIFYSFLDEKIKIWQNLWLGTKHLFRNIKKYLAGIAVIFIVYWIVNFLLIFLFSFIPFLLVPVVMLGFILYLNWLRYYFNRLSAGVSK